MTEKNSERLAKCAKDINKISNILNMGQDSIIYLKSSKTTFGDALTYQLQYVTSKAIVRELLESEMHCLKQEIRNILIEDPNVPS